MRAVATDRDDGAETPEASPDVPQPEGPRPSEPGERTYEPCPERVAELVRFRRVAGTAIQMAAARDAWTSTAPGLAAEWTAHKERYPDRERQAAATQPDGSWHGDGQRRLSAEQNAEAAKCAADLRDEAWGAIRPAMDRVAAADPRRHLAGLEHMLKGEDRLKEKLADAMEAPGMTVGEALDLVPDAVRFTLVYSSKRYADGVLTDVDRLKAEGFELIKLKNLWHTEQYKGVNSQWRIVETGARFEMQFHTPESLAAKELTHEAYERIRSVAPDARAAEDFQRRVNTLLTTPPDIDMIKDFPEKRQ